MSGAPENLAAESPFLAWRTLPFPTDWAGQFRESGPLVVEVGFGDGRFTVRRAQAEPETRFVGLEVSSGSLQRALGRVKRTGVTNVRLIKSGAHVALRQLFGPGSVDAMVVNFPCPWPKEKHARHRLLQRGFLELAAARLRPGGELRLATDHPEYLEFALEQAAESTLYEATWPEPPADVFETKYALKWREQGKPLHYVVFRRNPVEPPQFLAWERPEAMPHALFSGRLPASAPFEKRVLRYGHGHVILHELATVVAGEDGAGRWLVRTTVDEPDIRQQLLVVAQQRSPDEVIVRLETFGDPLITPTTRGAVHAVTDWLEGATSLSVTARNY
ncbi:MAG: tRNA (guanosine(46)-N7)-methyltransferase TrmB [Trueperaceae bacterium]